MRDHSKPPHTRAEMRVLYPVFRWWELAAGGKDTTHPRAGFHRCTRAAAHRWDTAPDGLPRAAHTLSASPALLAPPSAAGPALHDRQPGPQRGWDGTAHTTARPASAASAHAAASAGESPPRATSSVGARWIPRQPPPAVRDR